MLGFTCSPTTLITHLYVSQGDRGFDGLPGLPGDKGHRVSPIKEITTASTFNNQL